MYSRPMKKNFQVASRIVTDIFGKRSWKTAVEVIAEYVSNAWDANATEVKVTLPEPMTKDPLIIQDNGLGIDLDSFFTIGVAREPGPTPELNRLPIGERGVGRFSGFAIGQVLEFYSVTNGKSFKVVLKRDEIEKLEDIEDYPYEVEEEDTAASSTTEVKIYELLGRHSCYPGVEKVSQELVMEFGVSEYFTIFVNGQKIIPEDIPDVHKFLLTFESEAVGQITGFIVDLGRKPKRIESGIIIRVHNRRVEGPSFFGLEKQYDKRILKRIVGEFNADVLKDAITGLGYKFDQQDERYKEFIDWLRERLEEIVKVIPDKKIEEVKENLWKIPEFRNRWEKLPARQQEKATRILEVLYPKLTPFAHNTRILRILGVIILRAVESPDFALILTELEGAEDKDIKELAKVLRSWGIREVATISSLVKRRRKMLKAFAHFVNKKETLERDELHKVLEKNLWIINDTYTMVSSDESFKVIAGKLQSKFKEKASRERPDLILKGLGEGSFLIVELKRPKHTITLDDMTQLVKYRYELQRIHPKATDITAYLIGSTYKEEVSKEYPWGNDRRAFCLSLNEMAQAASKRLKWLEEHIESDVEEEEVFEELLKELQIEAEKVNVS